MSNIIPFNADAALPAWFTADDVDLSINKDVIKAAAFPTMSIRGKRFTLSRDGVKTVLTKPNEPDEVAQSINVVLTRVNMEAKVFYMKKYAEGDSDGAQPDCYSYNGETPSENARTPQAKKCALCPHNQWGVLVSEDGAERKGKRCADNARVAISPADRVDNMLLRVPPASLKNLREAVKQVGVRKIPYNGMVFKIGFDIEASSPKLTFKPVAYLDKSSYEMFKAAYDSELVRGIVGVDDIAHEGDELDDLPTVSASEVAAVIDTPAPKAEDKPKAAPKSETVVSSGDLDKALETAAESSKKAVAAKSAAKPAPSPAPAPAPSADIPDDLISGLDSLLNNPDD